jgi:cytoskeletal protein RodZ
VSEEFTAEAGLSGFGRWLARERELRGLSRDEVTRATKLAPGVVEALESGEEARMPPRAYVVGYLRSYAVAAGLDPDEVVLRYEEAAGAAPAKGKRAGAGVPARAVLAAIAAVVAAGAAIWAILH